MLVLLKYWKLAALASSLLAAMYLGHYLTSQAWQAEVNLSVAASEKAAKAGEVKIIHDTQVIYKAVHNANDACTKSAIPPAVLEQLRGD